MAIAYHIYLKGLYEQGITSGNLIDPTYKARLVKEQAGFTNEDLWDGNDFNIIKTDKFKSLLFILFQSTHFIISKLLISLI